VFWAVGRGSGRGSGSGKAEAESESCAPEVIKRGETMASVQPETEVDADKHQIRKGAIVMGKGRWWEMRMGKRKG